MRTVDDADPEEQPGPTRVATTVSYSRMTEEEAWALLSSSPPRPAILAITKRNGRAHAVPVWYALDGRTLVFTTGEATLKGRTLRRDPGLAMCVDDDHGLDKMSWNLPDLARLL